MTIDQEDRGAEYSEDKATTGNEETAQLVL